ATAEQSVVELLDRRLRGVIRPHGDECKAASSTCLAVSDQVNVGDLTDGLERCTDVVCRRAERQVSHIQSLTHVALSLPAPTHSVPITLAIRTGPCPEGVRSAQSHF